MPQVKAELDQHSVADVAHAPASAMNGGATTAAGHAALSRMLAHEDVGRLPLYDRLFKAALHGGHAFEHEALHSLISALEIAVPVWIISHAFGLGEVIDVIAVALAANDTVTAVEELITFFKLARDAKTEADLEKAGDHFGNAVALVGVAMLVGVFAKLGARGAEEHAPHVEEHAPHVEEHAPHVEEPKATHVTEPRLKPNVRAVITELENRGSIMEHLERAHKVGAGVSSGEEGPEAHASVRAAAAPVPADAAGAPTRGRLGKKTG